MQAQNQNETKKTMTRKQATLTILIALAPFAAFIFVAWDNLTAFASFGAN